MVLAAALLGRCCCGRHAERGPLTHHGGTCAFVHRSHFGHLLSSCSFYTVEGNLLGLYTAGTLMPGRCYRSSTWLCMQHAPPLTWVHPCADEVQAPPLGKEHSDPHFTDALTVWKFAGQQQATSNICLDAAMHAHTRDSCATVQSLQDACTRSRSQKRIHQKNRTESKDRKHK